MHRLQLLVTLILPNHLPVSFRAYKPNKKQTLLRGSLIEDRTDTKTHQLRHPL